MPVTALKVVKAQRGDRLRCKGWRQESILRMLENNLENAECTERLVVHGGIGKAARNWEIYYALVESLKNLENDETLAVQAGMPVAIFKTHRLAPQSHFVRCYSNSGHSRVQLGRPLSANKQHRALGLNGKRPPSSK
jgi:urocanate hydratase